jgi:hypothetical protein
MGGARCKARRAGDARCAVRRACVYALATSCACFCRFVATQPASSLQRPCTASADEAWAAGATGVVTVPLHGLLANLMFAVASLEGIASTLQRAPLLSISASCLCSGPGPDQDLSRRRVQAFAASFGLQLCEEGAENATWHEARAGLGWGRFDAQLLAEGAREAPRALRVLASFSPRYFHHLGRAYFRRLFEFPAHARAQAHSFLEDARAAEVARLGHDPRRLLVVGMHVRRGDKNWEFDMFNEWSHDAGYMQRAMRVVQRLYNDRSILYVVTTDDHAWVSATMAAVPNMALSPFVTSPGCKMDIHCTEPLVDMALLSLCDIVVVSGSSTYSWWAAYLRYASNITSLFHLDCIPLSTYTYRRYAKVSKET